MERTMFKKIIITLAAVLLSLSAYAVPQDDTGVVTALTGSDPYITDIMLIGGSTLDEAKSFVDKYEKEGWIFVYYDLNKGAGGDYIFLLYKAVEGLTFTNDDYITDFYISNKNSDGNSVTHNGRTYQLAPYDGGSHFKDVRGDLNSNKPESDDIHLYYTKAAFSDNRYVSGITFNNDSNGAVGVNGSTTSGYDLNKGAGGEYIYMHFTTCTALVPTPITKDNFGSLTWYDYRDTSFNPDTDTYGTFFNPIVIDTPEKLAQLSYLVNEEGRTFAGSIFTLGADINLDKTVNGEKVRWVPIGYKATTVFKGMFLGVESSSITDGWQSGNNHTISGMYVDAHFQKTNGDAYIGLFGLVRGYLGYLSLSDCTVKVSAATTNLNIDAGLLCGRTIFQDKSDNDQNLFQEIKQTYFKVPFSIYNVTTEGSLELSGEGKYAVGGISGLSQNYGICHSTSHVNISYSDPKKISAGGICGVAEPYSSMTTDVVIMDCAAHVNIEGDDTWVEALGGIAGTINSNTQVVGCTTSGKISVASAAIGMGGICGVLSGNLYDGDKGCRVQACTSLMHLEGRNNVGGIVGYIDDKNTENPGDALIDGCVFAGHINVTNGSNVGGILGGLNINRQAIGIYVSGCLMVGTMTSLNASADAYIGVIAGYTANASENIGGCYYDASLCGGNVVGGKATHSSIRGLSTDVLTSGNVAKMSMLPSDDTADYGFTVVAGYYPQVFCNMEWIGYKVFDNNSIRLSQSYPYWRYATIDKTNTLYQSGAWLASQPVSIPKGDAAYDLVTHVVAKAKETSWTETSGREIKVKSKIAYPLPCDYIKVSGDTATVVKNGLFITTMTVQPDKATEEVFNRPLPIQQTRVLGFNATPEQEWDGTIATEFAAGTGKAEDPYIIKNGAQLAYAVRNNEEGQFYRQLCDITLVKNLIDYDHITVHNVSYETTSLLRRQNRWWGEKWEENIQWNARYDGNGCLVKGAYMEREQFGLFGNIASSGVVENLGIVDAVIFAKQCGLLACKVEGTVRNCLFHGLVGGALALDVLQSDGGIAAYVGTENSDALIEDCVSAAFGYCYVNDYTPFVSLPESDNPLQNKGKVSNCLAVVPTAFCDENFDYHNTANGRTYIDQCYWLRGYEPTRTGYTLAEICSALSKRSRWTYSNGYFPTLKTFAKKDIARLMTLPVRTDEGYDDGYDQYLLGFDRQLLFEPASATWSSSDEHKYYIDSDGDMGVVVPVSAVLDYKQFTKVSRMFIYGTHHLIAKLGNATYAIPVRTRAGQVNPGITINDVFARRACMNAFDTNTNGNLSLDEVKAVDAEALRNAFQETQATSARRTEAFPELRFFKGVTELTTQLNGFSHLKEVKLPYALTTIGSDAFSGCTSLKEVTIPAKVNQADPHPFYGSAIENVYVDPFNENFTSRGGILYDLNDQLVAYPNGRTGDEIVLEGRITEFADGAIYKQPGLERLYFETDDYETVPYLNADGIVTDDGKLIDVYVSDATYGSVLMQAYYDDGSWDDYIAAEKLHCYYPLIVTSSLAATMYIGFDTKLPAQLTPYIVTSTDDEENIAYLRTQSRRVPNRTPVVIFATEPGKYRLMPLDEELERWKMYENRLNGVGRDGMKVYQSDSDRGSILTLGYNSAHTLGFYYYKGSRIPPYRAYLTYNWIKDENAKLFIRFADDDDQTGISSLPTGDTNEESADVWFSLDGRQLNSRPTERGIYINNGKKVVVK